MPLRHNNASASGSSAQLQADASNETGGLQNSPSPQHPGDCAMLEVVRNDDDGGAVAKNGIAVSNNSDDDAIDELLMNAKGTAAIFKR